MSLSLETVAKGQNSVIGGMGWGELARTAGIEWGWGSRRGGNMKMGSRAQITQGSKAMLCMILIFNPMKVGSHWKALGIGWERWSDLHVENAYFGIISILWIIRGPQTFKTSIYFLFSFINIRILNMRSLLNTSNLWYIVVNYRQKYYTADFWNLFILTKTFWLLTNNSSFPPSFSPW